MLDKQKMVAFLLILIAILEVGAAIFGHNISVNVEFGFLTLTCLSSDLDFKRIVERIHETFKKFVK